MFPSHVYFLPLICSVDVELQHNLGVKFHHIIAADLKSDYEVTTRDLHLPPDVDNYVAWEHPQSFDANDVHVQPVFDASNPIKAAKCGAYHCAGAHVWFVLWSDVDMGFSCRPKRFPPVPHRPRHQSRQLVRCNSG